MDLNFSIIFVKSCLTIMKLSTKAAVPTLHNKMEKQKHILTVAISLMFQSCVPIRFWGFCVNTVCYIINWLPSRVLEGQSPYQYLFNKMPSFDHMKVFGCLCYATNLKP